MRVPTRYLAGAFVTVGALALTTWTAPWTSDGDPGVEATVVVTLADDRIDESSGLVVRGDSLFTVNDSGDGPFVFEVDARTGETTGVTTYDAQDPVDVEAVAPGPGGTLWVGDIGDNGRSRGAISVHELIPRLGGGTVDATTYDLSYPDHPHDAEALLVHPRTGRVVVVTKQVLVGGTVFAAPARLREGAVHRLREVGRVPGLVTDGTFLPDGKHILLRTYGNAAVYTYPGLEEVASFALPRQEQGEAVAVAPGRGGGLWVYLTSEGTGSDVLALDLPDLTPSPTVEPSPTTAPTPTTAPQNDPAEATDRRRPGRPPGYAVAAVLGAVVVGLLVRASRRRSRRTR